MSKRLPIIFWCTALGAEAAALIGWTLFFGVFRNLVILLGAATGGLVATGVVFLVLLKWPEWKYKNDPGLSGPGMEHTYLGFLIPFGLINGFALFLNLYLV